MAQGEMHLLFEQMGEVLSGIRALHETSDVRQEQAEKHDNLVRFDLAQLRRDQRELEEKFECIVHIVQHEIEVLRVSAADNARSMDDMCVAVEALRRPVAEILGLKARVAGLVFGAGVVGSAALWLAQPIYGWLVNASFAKR
jgi:hypothetical protein